MMVLDCENGRSQVRRAMRSLSVAAHQQGARPAPGMLRICCRPEGIDLASRADVRWLHGRVQADRPDVIVLGPLYKLVNASPIDEEPAARTAHTLDSLRERYGCSLIIEAHSPHAQPGHKREMRPYGASLWKRWPEFGIGLVSDPDNPGHGTTVTHWRGPREERNWPRKLRMGGAFPWTVAP